MIALFFEVQPKPEAKQRYLDMAAALKPQLEKTDGFIGIDRYKSLARDGWVPVSYTHLTLPTIYSV